MKFLDLAIQVLKEEKKSLTADEIWQLAVQKGYDNKLKTTGKTPWATLAAKLYVDVRDNKDSSIAKDDSRPVKFYLKNDINIKQNQIEKNKILKPKTYLEKDLHPFLAYYAYNYLKCYTKTIQHSKSDKKEFGEWIHPDMVGCYFFLDEWKTEVTDFGSTIGNIAIKLFSFEIKKELSFSNLRESFFQTVSNSSWAHEGYLVAAEISTNDDFRSELRRLSLSFGIGVIKLNIEEPNSSEIICSARTKENLDWDAINKLAMNPDFVEFLNRLKNDIKSKEIRKEKYDKILSEEELNQRAKIFLYQ